MPYEIQLFVFGIKATQWMCICVHCACVCVCIFYIIQRKKVNASNSYTYILKLMMMRIIIKYYLTTEKIYSFPVLFIFFSKKEKQNRLKFEWNSKKYARLWQIISFKLLIKFFRIHSNSTILSSYKNQWNGSQMWNVTILILKMENLLLAGLALNWLRSVLVHHNLSDLNIALSILPHVSLLKIKLFVVYF